MQITFVALTLLSVLSSPLSAQNFGPQPTDATRNELLALRERAWRSWFSNDARAFKEIVPDELVAIGWGDGAWADRAESLHQMHVFAQSGNKLTALTFPENVFQQYGDVVILYTRFRVTLSATSGAEQVVSGRGTEVFVKRNRRWIHTGWHLDNALEN